MSDVLTNSVSFRMCYLLGVDVEYLKRDFKEEYNKTNELKLFENYVDAKTLRSLNRVRQSFIVDFANDIKKGKGIKEFSTNVKEDVLFLKDKGIDLEKAFKQVSLEDFLNYLGDMISVIQYKVLFDLEVPYVEEMQTCFDFPDMKNTKLVDIVSSYQELGNPYNIYIYRSENIRQTLKYFYHTDKNMIYSVHSMINKALKDEDFQYSYEYRATMGEDIDSSMVINSEELLKKYTEVPSVSNIVKIEIPHPLMLNKKVQNIAYSIMDYIKDSTIEIFVDCDNIEFFKFITFLSTIDSMDTVKSLVLVIDEKSNYLWRVFEKFYTGNLQIRSISVPRLKEQKSVADIILTKEVCYSVYKNNINRVLLVSSDSDFFGLVSALPEISFGVCYTANAMGAEYLNYLHSQNIPTIDLQLVDSEEIVKKYTDKALTYYMLNVLSYLPMSGWSIGKISTFMYDSFSNETDKSLDLKYIENFVSKNISKVTLDIKEDKVILYLNNIKVVLQ